MTAAQAASVPTAVPVRRGAGRPRRAARRCTRQQARSPTGRRRPADFTPAGITENARVIRQATPEITSDAAGKRRAMTTPPVPEPTPPAPIPPEPIPPVPDPAPPPGPGPTPTPPVPTPEPPDPTPPWPGTPTTTASRSVAKGSGPCGGITNRLCRGGGARPAGRCRARSRCRAARNAHPRRE